MTKKINKNLFNNLILNTIGTALPIAILQVFIYPNLASIIGNDNYGLVLTIYSIWMLSSSYICGAICSAKIINNEKYNSIGETGDFLIIVRRWLILSTIVTYAILVFYSIYNKLYLSWHRLLLDTIIMILIFLATYLESGFRITLEYKKLTINKIILSLGYFVGYYCFVVSNYWEFIFIVGYGLSLIYSFCFSINTKEKNVKTNLYTSTLRDCRILVFPSLITGIVSYADKLVLYPLIGGENLAIYYVSTLIGKIVELGAGSIKDVILSYISKKDENDRKVFFNSLLVGIILALIGYLAIIIIGKPILSFLYPQLFVEVVKYFPITTVSAMINVVIYIVYPFVLIYCDTKWQIVFNFVFAVIYLVISLSLLRLYGLYGFCFGTVISLSVKLIIMIIIYIKESDDNV